MVNRGRGIGIVAVVMLIGALGVFLAMTGETATRAEEREVTSLAERLQKVDDALARVDLSAATFAWHEAYGVALGTVGWEPLVAVADRALRIDVLSGGSKRFRDEARTLYRFALFRARSTHSVEGMRRAADGFSALGQTDFAERVRVMAQRGA